MLPGIYRVTHDIKNPHPDRRSRDWNCQPVFKAGLVVYLTKRNGREWLTSGKWSHIGFYQLDDGFEALIQGLKPVDLDSVELLFQHLKHVEGHYVLPSEVLQHLVNQKYISLEAIAKIVRDSNV